MEHITKKFAGMVALVVDDYIVNQELNKELLSLMDCDVDIAEDGLDGLEKYSQRDYDVVFLDIQMPNLDGFGFTEKVRADEAGSGEHVIIIAVTANVFSGEREKCINAGMDEYIGKPIKAKQLEDMLVKFFPERETT